MRNQNMTNQNKIPFVDITDDEWVDLATSGATWGDINERYHQPQWCDYENALDGIMGCWALVTRQIKTIEDCKDCECCIHE